MTAISEEAQDKSVEQFVKWLVEVEWVEGSRRHFLEQFRFLELNDFDSAVLDGDFKGSWARAHDLGPRPEPTAVIWELRRKFRREAGLPPPLPRDPSRPPRALKQYRYDPNFDDGRVSNELSETELAQVIAYIAAHEPEALRFAALSETYNHRLECSGEQNSHLAIHQGWLDKVIFDSIGHVIGPIASQLFLPFLIRPMMADSYNEWRSK